MNLNIIVRQTENNNYIYYEKGSMKLEDGTYKDIYRIVYIHFLKECEAPKSNSRINVIEGFRSFSRKIDNNVKKDTPILYVKKYEVVEEGNGEMVKFYNSKPKKKEEQQPTQQLNEGIFSGSNTVVPF